MAEDKDPKQKPKETKERNTEDKDSGPIVWYFVAIVVLLIAAGVGAYWWRDQEAKEAQQQSQQKIEQLEEEVKQLKEADAEEKETEETTEETTTVPTAADLANIQDAVESENYAALEDYMSESVTVILAASECCGGGTPADAIANMDYASNGTAPWDWNVSEATIDNYRAGFYVDYFPEGVLVGKGANDFIISFSFDGAGKITTIFMSINDSILM